MKRDSHRCLGKYLARQFMSQCPKRHVRAFLFGCVEPDQNPATYLKGSIRYEWLRGHNYRNAKRLILRLSRRLEQRQKLGLFDYYSIGKLIHYITDSFTFAHNDTFPPRLALHRAYETELQKHFLKFLSLDPIPIRASAATIPETILAQHTLYRSFPMGVHTDTLFAFSTCCFVASALLEKNVRHANSVDFPLALFHHPWYNVRSLETWRLSHDCQRHFLLL